jgi:hypothetical protein
VFASEQLQCPPALVSIALCRSRVRLAEKFRKLGDVYRDGLASSPIGRCISAFPPPFRLQRSTQLNNSPARGAGSGGLAMRGVMRALIARGLALITMLGLLALVVATSRIPCVPYGLWPTLQMHCR